ncbi:DUF2231 domain-containing protein [Tessaracoccus sp.]
MAKYQVINESLTRLADQPIAETIAAALDPAADAIEDHRELYDTLTGESITGHPIHPALVHMPIGITMAAVALDAVGMGRFRTSTTILTGLTVTLAIPTALTGLAEWTRGRRDGRQRRVGAIHAAAASTGTTFAALSFVMRLVGAHGAGRVVLLGAAGAYALAGFVGGDLVYGGALISGREAENAD